MIDYFSLIKGTSAYKAIKNDKQSGRLSHAYLLLCADSESLAEYTKIFAEFFVCNESEPCGQCRACKLIEKKSYPDATFYPINSGSVTVDDINDLIEKSYLRPLERDKKLFIIEQGESMTVAAQNKLLKTLEEPPENTHIIIAAASEFPLLSTIKSRVKRLEIPAFSDTQLFDALKGEYADEDKLKNAISCGDGSVGTAIELYGSDRLLQTEDFIIDLICNMQSSANVLDYSIKLDNVLDSITGELKERATEKAKELNRQVDNAKKTYYTSLAVEEFLCILESCYRDMLLYKQDKADNVLNKTRLSKIKDAKGYNSASLIYALDKIGEARKRKYFNASGTMLNEWLLFSILEGKHKWQR